MEDSPLASLPVTIRVRFTARLALAAALGALVLFVPGVSGQSGPSTISLIARDGRRTLQTMRSGGRDLIALDEIVAAFDVAAREDGGALTVSSGRRTAIVTADRPIASVNGRLVALPSPPIRVGSQWAVPPEFVSRALTLVLDTPIEWRAASRLLVVGTLRVPRMAVLLSARAGSAQIVIDSAPATPATVTRDGAQLSIRFDADALDVAIPPLPPEVLGLGVVQNVRLRDATSITVDVGRRFGTYRATTAPSSIGSRLELSLAPMEGAPAPADGAAPSSRNPAPPTERPGAPLVQPDAPSPRAVPAAAPWTIVLDPGHGGDDTGSRGAAGTLEKDVALAAARRLRAAIESRLGARVLMTRDDDRMVALESRTSLANNNKADLLISLHANWAPRPSTAGTTIYLAAFEDNEAPRPDPPSGTVPLPGGRSREIALVPWERAQRSHLDRSADFAARLEARLQGVVPFGPRAVERLPLPLLEAANMPAVLIEMGYLSHPEQEQQLSNGSLSNQLVQAIVDVVAAFRSGVPEHDRP